jgi:hypothetical protein
MMISKILLVQLEPKRANQKKKEDVSHILKSSMQEQAPPTNLQMIEVLMTVISLNHFFLSISILGVMNKKELLYMKEIQPKN